MELNGNRTYRLRGSRITEAQASARARLAPLYEIIERTEIELPSYFNNPEKVIMEIGFGMGEATALIAQAQPENGFLAVEVHPPGVGKLMARLEEKNLTNVKIISEDVHLVLEKMIPDQSLDGIYLFFPDPWPKTKHHKRRIITDEFLTQIAPKIKHGGYFHAATDWVPYAEWMKAVFARSSEFEGGEVERPEWRPVTRFEGQGLDKSHRVTDLRYVRR